MNKTFFEKFLLFAVCGVFSLGYHSATNASPDAAASGLKVIGDKFKVGKIGEGFAEIGQKTKDSAEITGLKMTLSGLKVRIEALKKHAGDYRNNKITKSEWAKYEKQGEEIVEALKNLIYTCSDICKRYGGERDQLRGDATFMPSAQNKRTYAENQRIEVAKIMREAQALEKKLTNEGL